MPTLTQYLDKEPTRSYTLGPSGKGIAQTGFADLWQGWFQAGVGITYVKDVDYNVGNPTGFHASGSENILFAKSFSFTFDSGANLWATINNFNTVNVFQFSGSTYLTKATFSGIYPVIYYNVANNLPQNRYVNCFYLKSGDNKIYARTNQDNFSGEYVLHQDFDSQVKSLNHASRYPYHPNKMEIFGLYANGDGFEMISDCFTLFNTGVFLNFSGMNTGTLTNINEWECVPAVNFTPQLALYSESFSVYPTGNVNFTFDSGVNTSGGYLFQWP